MNVNTEYFWLRIRLGTGFSSDVATAIYDYEQVILFGMLYCGYGYE